LVAKISEGLTRGLLQFLLSTSPFRDHQPLFFTDMWQRRGNQNNEQEGMRLAGGDSQVFTVLACVTVGRLWGVSDPIWAPGSLELVHCGDTGCSPSGLEECWEPAGAV